MIIPLPKPWNRNIADEHLSPSPWKYKVFYWDPQEKSWIYGIGHATVGAAEEDAKSFSVKYLVKTTIVVCTHTYEPPTPEPVATLTKW